MILLCNRRCIIIITLSLAVELTIRLLLAATISCSCVVRATTATTYAPGGRARQRTIPSAFIKKKKKKTTNYYATKSYNPSATSVSYEKFQDGILHNFLLQKAIGNCLVQTTTARSAENNRRDDDRQQQLTTSRSRSDVLYNIRGGSSYASGNDDYNDNGYNSGYRNDGVDDSYYNDNDGYYGNSNSRNAPSSSSSSSYRDDYYEEDYQRGSERGSNGNGYYDDEGRYHDDYDDRGRGSSSRRRSSRTKLPTALTSSNRKLGIIFLSSGAAFTALGITLFFNKTLMRLGNLLFVVGVPLMIGPGRTVGYFLQPKKARATGCLAVGILLVLVGHPVIGILLEIFGLLNLFGNMFPLIMMMAKNMPVVGNLFNGSGSSGGGSKSSGKRRERYDDRYYEDRYEQDEYRRDETYDRY